MYYRSAQSRRRNPLLRTIVLLLILGGLGFLVYNYHDTAVTMHAHPTVVVERCSGYVHVRANQSIDTVVIQGLASILIPRSYNERRNQLIISGCNLVLTVPAVTDLNITASSIDVFGVQGQMTLHTNGGTITLAQSTLQGKSELSNNGGSTIFDGTLDPKSASTFDSNGGSIDITLPRNALFHLDVTGIMSTFTTNFPTLQAKRSEVHTDVGQSPGAKLELDVNGSPIVLKGI